MAAFQRCCFLFQRSGRNALPGLYKPPLPQHKTRPPSFCSLAPALHAGPAEHHLLAGPPRRIRAFSGALAALRARNCSAREPDFQRGQVGGHLLGPAGPDKRTRDAGPGQGPGQGHLGQGSGRAGRLLRAGHRERCQLRAVNLLNGPLNGLAPLSRPSPPAHGLDALVGLARSYLPARKPPASGLQGTMPRPQSWAAGTYSVSKVRAHQRVLQLHGRWGRARRGPGPGWPFWWRTRPAYRKGRK